MVFRSRWTPEEKIAVVMESLDTNISMAELCRKHNVTPGAVGGWKEKFVQGGKAALTGTLRDPGRDVQEENERLKKLIGEFAIANDALKKAQAGGKRR